MTLSTSSRVVVPGGALRGELRPPPDKSITHRAVFLSALAQGTSRIVHPLTADDCERSAEAFRTLGISIETVKEHVQNILRKLGCADRTAAAVLALRTGMS